MDDILAEILANPMVGAAGTALASTAVALWVAAAWWAYRDAGRRSESNLAAYVSSAWIVLATPIFLPLALLIYRAARPQVSAADQRASALARELSQTMAAGPACSGCGMAVDAAWLRCPDCATWLAASCSACARWSDPGFEICPWCGADQQHAPELEQLPKRERLPEPALDRQPGRQRVPVAVAAAVTAAVSAAVTDLAAHGTAAADAVSAAAGMPVLQRRAISSARPLSYSASRDTSSTSS